jgi:hypothetical protein
MEAVVFAIPEQMGSGDIYSHKGRQASHYFFEVNATGINTWKPNLKLAQGEPQPC